MKRIFIGQSELNNGRNRNNRRLIARLDSENGFSSPLTILDTGEETSKIDSDIISTSFHPPPVYTQKQIEKFYLRYGKDWRELYIGSKL